jgi:hypothetical protein
MCNPEAKKTAIQISPEVGELRDYDTTSAYLDASLTSQNVFCRQTILPTTYYSTQLTSLYIHRH